MLRLWVENRYSGVLGRSPQATFVRGLLRGGRLTWLLRTSSMTTHGGSERRTSIKKTTYLQYDSPSQRTAVILAHT
jgi:hypothetical protein